MKPTAVNDRMMKLKTLGNVVIQPGTHYSIVSIVNWDAYQGIEEKPDTQPDTQPTPNRQPTDTNKNDKNVGKEKPTASRDKNHAQHEVDEPVFWTLPTNNCKPFPVAVAYLSQLCELYPAVDVKNEIRAMAGWLDANPKNRKTAGGMKRFITNWLKKQQDRAPRVPGEHQATTTDNHHGMRVL
ncbi:MAG: hypothetical protein ABIL58_29455 [Pseudomonadota bacterium]